MKTRAVDSETLERVVQALRKVKLFNSLSEEQIRWAAGRALLLQAEPGETLVQQGEADHRLDLVLSGELKIMVTPEHGGDSVEIARFGPSEMVGLAGVLLRQPNGATVVASARTTVARFDADFLTAMAQAAPAFGLDVARVLAQRLTRIAAQIPMPEAGENAAPDGALLAMLPAEFMTRHRLVPVEVEGSVLTVGFAEPPTPEVMSRIRTHLPAMQVRAVRLDARRLDQALQAAARGALTSADQPTATSADLEQLLRAMVSEGASDLHLSGGERPRWRVDGEMRELTHLPVLGPETVLELLGEALPERNRREFTASNDTDFAYPLADAGRFRVNLFRDTGGVGAVLRLIPSRILGLEALGMPPAVSGLCDLPKGLVLVTGPTGSGKSTTLAAMVDHINRTRREHIITLEDPVEFVHPSQLSLVNQREVGPHTQSFARALRAALREDPDIVLVGEMRDLETIALALETANTGHLVFGTLHTATAISTVDRIVGMFPADEQNRIRATLADVLRGVVSQNLLKRIGGGRVAAVEILVVNHAVANLIREGKTNQIASAMQTGKAVGNQLLNDTLAALVRSSSVEPEEALSKAVDKAELARALGRAQPPV